MTATPNAPLPPPPSPWLASTPGAYVPPAPWGPARASSSRLVALFVLLLVGGVVIGAVTTLALQRAPAAPRCPDPVLPCGTPGTLTPPPGTGTATPPPPTPAPTIVRPGASLVIPTASTAPASARPSPAIAVNLPQPLPASSAEPLRNGVLWTSSAFGFTVQYNPGIWALDSQAGAAISLSAWQGSVMVSIQGFDPSSDPASLIQQKVARLGDSVLGLTRDTDVTHRPPGRPFVGFRRGEGELLTGTLNNPQGPTTTAGVAILAATDGQVAIVVTVLAPDSLRDAAFYFSDAVLNSIRWPADS